MSQISKRFYEKYKPKILIQMNLKNRDKILEAVENTPEFIIDIFWEGSEIYKFLSSKRKRTEPKLAKCLVEIKRKKIISFIEVIDGDDYKIYFWNGQRSDNSYGKRIFSDDELLALDDGLGEVKTYEIYECDDCSRLTGEFSDRVKAKTWKQAIDKVKKIRETEYFYNAREIK